MQMWGEDIGLAALQAFTGDKKRVTRAEQSTDAKSAAVALVGVGRWQV